MTKNLDQADKVYHELLQHVLKLIKEDVSIEMVAASLMSNCPAIV